MSNFIIPLKAPKPDVERFVKAVRGEVAPERPPMCEYLVDDALMRPILQDMLGREWVEKSDKTEYMGGQMEFTKESLSLTDAWLDNQIAFWYHMGYDYVRVEVSLPLPAVSLITKDTAEGNTAHNRAWQGLDDGPIRSWDDFYKYPWPQVTDDAFYIHRYICEHLPEGMGFMTCHAGGVYEHVSRLMGYTGMCAALIEQPDLVRAVADRLGGLIFEYNKRLLALNELTAIFQGEDLGYNTQTLISPDDIREYILPWHKKFAAQTHEADKLYFFHSCGKIDCLMDELINDVKIDGKHSFQDNVLSVQEHKMRWGERLALLGGVDVHALSTFQEPELRVYIRRMIEDCAPGGRFAIGAGNSIASYIPMNNYLTLLDEALK